MVYNPKNTGSATSDGWIGRKCQKNHKIKKIFDFSDFLYVSHGMEKIWKSKAHNRVQMVYFNKNAGWKTSDGLKSELENDGKIFENSDWGKSC